MADPYVREVGSIEDLDGSQLAIGVDYDTVALYVGGWLSADGVRLTAAQAEEFAQLFVSACWQAGQQKRQMAEEVYEAGGGRRGHAPRGCPVSASNWDVCPRCVKRAKETDAERLAEVMATYGKVPPEQFDAALTAVRKPVVRDFQTFREDYEIYGAANGEVVVSYGGGCDACGLSLSFTHRHPLAVAGDG